MLKQLIIYGAGNGALEAYDFFGSEHIFCFVDSAPEKWGTFIRGKKVISPVELKSLFAEKNNCADIMFEVVISVTKTVWATLSIATKLEAAGIMCYSSFGDIRNRWANGEAYMRRNTEVFPFERESILNIKARQFDYVKRHIDASSLLPATGELREKQLETLDDTLMFFEWIKEQNINPIATMGTLLGAVRHKGFIPWDEDLDFMLVYDDYCRLLDLFKEKAEVFAHVSGRRWENDKGKMYSDQDCKYLAFIGLGFIQVYHNDHAPFRDQNRKICDIFPLYSYGADMTDERFKSLSQLWYNRRLDDFDASGEPARLFTLKESQRNPSTRLGYGFDTTSWGDSYFCLLGKRFDNYIWDKDQIFPLSEVEFEGHMLMAPASPDAILKKAYGTGYMSLPGRTGVYVHNKDRFFKDEY